MLTEGKVCCSPKQSLAKLLFKKNGYNYFRLQIVTVAIPLQLWQLCCIHDTSQLNNWNRIKYPDFASIVLTFHYCAPHSSYKTSLMSIFSSKFHNWVLDSDRTCQQLFSFSWIRRTKISELKEFPMHKPCSAWCSHNKDFFCWIRIFSSPCHIPIEA